MKEYKRIALFEYNGEKLAMKTIARKAGVKDVQTLKRYYEKTGDIYKAIEEYFESKIEYNGEKLTLDAIAKKEGLKRDTLERYYNSSGNIYEAVKICLEIRKKTLDAKIVYKGKETTITTIAKEIGMRNTTLKKYYEITGDVDSAIELYNKTKKEKEMSKHEYKGKHKSLKAIAKDEEVPETTLRRYFEKYGNMEKAVFMAKIQRQRNRQVKIKAGEVNLYDLSIILGIKYSELINSLNKGMSIEEIKEQHKKDDTRVKLKQEYNILQNGQSLLEYCVEKGLNYSYIYRAINTYGKTLEESIEEYRKNGSKKPTNWIYEKYGILLRHLMTSNGIDVQRVIDYMRKDEMSMDEAIEKYVIRKNAKDKKIDAEWMEEVYKVLTDINMSDEYDRFKEIFFIDQKEEQCVSKSYEEIQNLQRKLLLFEIAEAFKENTFTPEEIPELLQVYQVQPNEIETIFLDLYNEFDNGIVNGSEQPQVKRKQVLNEIIKKWYYLGQDDRENILEDNEITIEEKKMIVDLSNKIANYKNMLTTGERDKSIGEYV